MPNRAQTRKDPQKGKKEFSKNKGFTVIELMITVAVLAIIMSLALPSYRMIIEKRKVTSGAEQLAAFLSAAQIESVKRNQFVGVNYRDEGGNWCLSMAAADDDSASCNCLDDSCSTGSEFLREFEASVLTEPGIIYNASVGGGDDTIVFDPVRGLVTGAESVVIQMISPDAESYALNVEMSPTGRVNICSDSDRADHSVPGFEEC